jgi:hypothetical protein
VAAGVSTMNMSSNELQMAVLKACRGIGLPVAQAQDVAAAIAISPWALKQLLFHLARPTTPARFEFSAGVDVKNACILRDFSTCADAARLGVSPVVLRELSLCDVIEAMALYRGVSAKVYAGGVLLTAEERPVPVPAPSRCDVDTMDWQVLGKYAALTYVPESDASRLAGAGAELSDND